MRATTIFLFALLCSFGSLIAQDTSMKIKIYKAWVTVEDKPNPFIGALYERKDSSIILSESYDPKDYTSLLSPYAPMEFGVKEIPIDKIIGIKLRRPSNAGKGALIGALSGLLLGVVIGLASGDDPPCQGWFCIRYTAGQKALMAGIPLTIAGAGLGAAFGSIKIKIPINKSQNNYNMAKLKLWEYSIKKK